MCRLRVVLALGLLLGELGQLSLALPQPGLDTGRTVERELVLLFERGDLVFAFTKRNGELLGVFLLRAKLVIEL